MFSRRGRKVDGEGVDEIPLKIIDGKPAVRISSVLRDFLRPAAVFEPRNTYDHVKSAGRFLEEYPEIGYFVFGPEDNKELGHVFVDTLVELFGALTVSF